MKTRKLRRKKFWDIFQEFKNLSIYPVRELHITAQVIFTTLNERRGFNAGLYHKTFYNHKNSVMYEASYFVIKLLLTLTNALAFYFNELVTAV
jgi:hypothetical protein